MTQPALSAMVEPIQHPFIWTPAIQPLVEGEECGRMIPPSSFLATPQVPQPRNVLVSNIVFSTLLIETHPHQNLWSSYQEFTRE